MSSIGSFLRRLPPTPQRLCYKAPAQQKAATRMPPPTAAASQPTVAPQWQPRPSANAQPAAAIGSAAYPCGRAHNPSAAWGPRLFGFPGVGLLLALPAAAHAAALRAAARTMALRLCCALPPAACASGFVSSALRVVRQGLVLVLGLVRLRCLRLGVPARARRVGRGCRRSAGFGWRVFGFLGAVFHIFGGVGVGSFFCFFVYFAGFQAVVCW